MTIQAIRVLFSNTVCVGMYVFLPIFKRTAARLHANFSSCTSDRKKVFEKTLIKP